MPNGAKIFTICLCIVTVSYLTFIAQTKQNIFEKLYSFRTPAKEVVRSNAKSNQNTGKDENGQLMMFHDNCPQENIRCVNLTTVNTPICVHSNDLVSGYLIRTGEWEPILVNIFMKLLIQYSTAGFIDIGANLGVYSLVAAKMGRQVLSVEPWFDNLCRVHMSLMLGKLQRNVKLLLNAISVKRGTAVMSSNPGNRGAQHISIVGEQNHENNTSYMKTILLEDVLNVTKFKSAIVKFDIEGHEWLLIESIGSFIGKINVVAFVFETHPGTSLYAKNCPRLYDMMSSKGYQAYYNPITKQKIEVAQCGNYNGNVFWVKK